MNEKGILKMVASGDGRLMHYTKDGDQLLVLSMNDTDLIGDIKADADIAVVLDLKGGEQLPASVKINEKTEDAKALFSRMSKEDNNYFKTFDEKLIILEVTLK